MINEVMQSLIISYRQSDTAQIDRILSEDENTRVVRIWLENHPHPFSESPLLNDLKNRVTPEAAGPVLPQIMPARQGLLDASAIEEKILSGKIHELYAYFREKPDELMNYVDLIQTHFELGTLDINDRKVLPPLLDHLSTEDLTTVLRAKNEEQSVLNRLNTLQGLTKSQIYRLSAILAKPEFASDAGRLRDGLPSEYMRMLTEKTEEIKILGDTEDDFAALAHYIESKEIPLWKLEQKGFGKDFFIRLVTHLRYVDLQGFKDIPLANDLIKKSLNLNQLFIDDGKMLEGVQLLPNCRELYCTHCANLTELPALPNCHKLDCRGCKNLNQLPALPNCHKLDCRGCENLNQLPALPNCHKLDCSGCENLNQLPALPNCRELICRGCKNLNQLSALPNCHELDCSGCENLTELPALPNCHKLYCSDCKNLTELPALPNCLVLYCSGCENLNQLPALPNCRVLFCSGCLFQGLPELPWNTRVYGPGTGVVGFTSLDVDIDRLTQEPLAFLKLLGGHLLQNKPFPNVYYFEKGMRSEAIDIGGIRRDFVTRLCEGLFKEERSKGFLKLREGFPYGVDDEKEAFRTIGRIFAYCYPENSYFKTGPLFDEAVYRCILSSVEPGSDEWLLRSSLQCKGVSEELRDFIIRNDTRKLNSEELQSLMHLAVLDEEASTQEYFNDLDNRRNLRNELLDEAKKDERLKAITWIAQEMKAKVAEVLPNDLRDRIEGILSPDTLIAALKWEFTETVREPQKTRNYLETWIRGADKQRLERFVRAVTGNRTLTHEGVIVQVFDRDKGYIPVSHTCFYSIELSGNYKDQGVFNQKLNYFIENSLAGTGFTAG